MDKKIKEVTTVDDIIRKLESRKQVLEANPRSLQILENALREATRLARLESRRNEKFKKEYRIGL